MVFQAQKREQWKAVHNQPSGSEEGIMRASALREAHRQGRRNRKLSKYCAIKDGSQEKDPVRQRHGIMI